MAHNNSRSFLSGRTLAKIDKAPQNNMCAGAVFWQRNAANDGTSHSTVIHRYKTAENVTPKEQNKTEHFASYDQAIQWFVQMVPSRHAEYIFNPKLGYSKIT
eukprot:6350708-Amphidinium_carterae.1